MKTTMKHLIFLLTALLVTTQTSAATWLHITDVPWAGFNGQLTYAVTSQHARPAAGDLDNDGGQDVVIGAYDGTLVVY